MRAPQTGAGPAAAQAAAPATGGLIGVFRRIFDVLTPTERRRFLQLMALLFGVGVVEAVGVAGVLPFVAIASDPSLLESQPTLAALAGAIEPGRFLALSGLALFAVIVIGLAFKAFAFHALFRFTGMRAQALATRLMQGYLGQDYAWFLDRNAAQLGRMLLVETDRVMQRVIVPAARLVANAAIVLAISALLVAVQPVAAAAAAAILGVAYGAVYLAVRGPLRRCGAAQLRAAAERHAVVADAFGGVKELKAQGLERAFLGRFRKPAEAMAQSEAAAMTLTETPRFVVEAVAFGGMLLFAVALLSGGGQEGLSRAAPLLGLYAAAGVRLFPACQQIFAAAARMRGGAARLEALHATLREVGAVAPSPASVPGLDLPASDPAPVRDPAMAPAAAARRWRHVALRDVTFTFPGASRPALDGVSLEIAAGARLALVGESGAGKTTAIDVLLGLLTPQRGALEVDGAALAPDDLAGWRRAIGYAPQTAFIADDTIAANIAFGVSPDKIDQAAVEQAARQAGLHDVVMALPQGYRTGVGERGARLSGGQRQRIGIARALYRAPSLLLLDEATSALDADTEARVMQAIAARRDLTVLVVSHHRSAIAWCDEAVVFANGRLAARGPFASLAQDRGILRFSDAGALTKPEAGAWDVFAGRQ